MGFYCFKCGCKLQLSDTSQIGRRETCHNCQADLHVCRNCQHYDPKAYNECHEPQAERVLEKQESNFCDYFRFSNNSPENQGSLNTEKEAALKKLDELFK